MNVATSVDYRQTFLRRHIERELGSRARREEILALANLRYRLERAFKPEVRETLGSRLAECLTPETFFYGWPAEIGLSKDCVLYQPIRVMRPMDGLQPRKDWDDLSALLQTRELDRRGVVLRSRSGAGKTVAMLKSFSDCIFPREKPRLAGFLPCYLRDLNTNARPIKDALKDPDGVDAEASLIERLIVLAAGLPDKHSGWAEDWLHQLKMPLLVFVDLNIVGETVALALARGLSYFQEKYASRGVGGHSCVVAYRSSGSDSDITSKLDSKSGFAYYDLLPLGHGDAVDYIGRLTQAEQGLRRHLEGEKEKGTESSTPTCDIGLLERLLHVHARDDNSVLSTPLLMHLFSVLPVSSQSKVRCLANLYREVVEEYLNREYGFEEGRPRDSIGPPLDTPHGRLLVRDAFKSDERDLIKAALVRVALAILSQSSGEGEVVTRLQPDPESSGLSTLRRLLGSEWPADFKSPANPVYDNVFSRVQINSLRQLSLLRWDKGTYGFLHDSFLYWFAALSVRCLDSPEDQRPISPKGGWYEQAVARLKQSPILWRLPAEFLGGMLKADELGHLVRLLLATEPKKGLPELIESLVRGRQDPEDSTLQRIELALRHKPGRLAEFPWALRAEVVHYLRDAGREPGPDWTKDASVGPSLVSRRPTYWPPPRLQGLGEVVQVVLKADGRVVAADVQGRVVSWDPDLGTTALLTRHTGRVNCLASSQDGRFLVSGGEDGEVRRIETGSSDVKVLIRHARPVIGLAITPDGNGVASADESSVWWSEGDREGVRLAQFNRFPIRCVALSDRTVWWGDEGGFVWRIVNDRSEQVSEIELASRTVHRLAISPDGSKVLAAIGSEVHQLAIHSPSKLLFKHNGMVTSLVVSANGETFASGGKDGRLFIKRGDTPGVPVKAHSGEVSALAVSDDGGIVVSGGQDCRVLRVTFAVPPLLELQELQVQEGAVTAVAIQNDGRTVVSGGKDGTVRRTTTEPTNRQPREPITAVAVSGNGRVIVGGRDDGKILLAEVNQEVRSVPAHTGKVTALAVCASGQVVISGGADRLVRRIRAGVPDPRALLGHKRAVGAVAVNPDGSIVVSGGEDGMLHITVDDPQQRRSWPHGDPIRATAISRDGSAVVSGGDDGLVLHSRDRNRPAKWLIRHPNREVVAVAVSADGTTVASAGTDKQVHQAGSRPAPSWLHDCQVLAICFRGTEQWVAGATGDRIEVWRDGKQQASSPPLLGWLASAAVRSLAWADEIPLLVAGLANGEILELEVVNG